MFRRTILQWILSGFATFSTARKLLSSANQPELDPSHLDTLRSVANIVLPDLHGDLSQKDVANRFVRWFSSYPAGADAGYGYGHPRPRVLPANPAQHYLEQLADLDKAAAPKGVAFARLSADDQRTVLSTALKAAEVTNIPPRPNGKHVAADLMSFFYTSSLGEDCLYDAAIRREDCRGLASSAQPPAKLT